MLFKELLQYFKDAELKINKTYCSDLMGRLDTALGHSHYTMENGGFLADSIISYISDNKHKRIYEITIRPLAEENNEFAEKVKCCDEGSRED